MGIKNLKSKLSDHEYDAVTCAFVGKLFLDGKAVAYGSVEDAIIMPAGEKKRGVRVLAALAAQHSGAFSKYP